MLEIGSLVDNKYKILSEIGHGGMSNVYMAINERANKTWAVKEVRKNGTADFKTVKQGIIAETNVLKNLRHPNLPSIIDVLENEESIWIVMDYIEGNTLTAVTEEYGAIPQKYVVQWAKTLCEVLLYLHTRIPPIIYRDMKPGNVMLKPDGTLVLIDFGTAREFKECNLSDTVCLGTLGYAAPEQFGGMGQTDARTDIYGLGATMYHLVTGCNPGTWPYEIKPIRQTDGRLSGGLEQIIEKCTQRNPEERYQSAAELMYALEHYEEMDGVYRKTQKKRLICFICIAFLIVFFWCGGLVCDSLIVKESNHLYENILDKAAKATDYSEKLELYGKGIEVPGKSGELKAYLGFIQTYKENDMAFTWEESHQLIKYIQNHKSELQENVENYVEICFEVGKLYWYYFVEEDGRTNTAVRGKYAAEWFQDVLKYAPPEYENLGMAQVYARIGAFYRDITMNIMEANDRGKYALLYEDIRMLLYSVAENRQESEIVRLELLEFVQKAIWQYASQFQKDGIREAELEDLLLVVANTAAEMETTTEKTAQKRENIITFLDDTRKAMENAFHK